MSDVFISYSRRDGAFVRRLSDLLGARDRTVWVDWEDIPATAEWFREIQDGIDSSDAFLYVLSPDSVASEVCGREFDHALARNKRIVPILARDVDPNTVRDEAAALNWIDMRDGEGIDTLVHALDTDLEHVHAHTKWSQEAIQWERSGHDRSLLARGSELAEAEYWLTSAVGKQPEPTELQGMFVQRSREAARRRTHIVLASVSFALIVAIVLAVVALIQRSHAIHERQVAFSRELTAQAQNQYDRDPELSVLLARRAAEVAPGPATEEALREALGRSNVRATYRTSGDATRAIAWAPDGQRLLVAGGDGRARIHRPPDRRATRTLAAPGLSGQIAWSADGSRVVTGGAHAIVWDAHTGRALLRLREEGAQAVALAPGGDRIAVVDRAGTARVHSVDGGRQVARLAPRPGQSVVSCLRWSPRGDAIAQCTILRAASRQVRGDVRVWSAQTGRERFARRGPLVLGAAFSPNGRELALARPGAQPDDPGTFVLDARTGRELARYPEAGTAVAYAPEGDKLAYATLGGTAHVRDLRGGAHRILSGHTDRIDAIDFSPSGTQIATGSVDHTARIWDAASGQSLMVLAGHADRIRQVAFDSEGTALATSSDDGTARVWRTPTPRPLRRLATGGAPPDVLAFGPDDRRAVILGPGPAGRVLDVPSLRTRVTLRPPAGRTLAGAFWAQDSRHLAVLTSRGEDQNLSLDGVVVYDIHTGRPRRSLAPFGSPLAWIDVAAGGDRVAGVGQDGTAVQWDARSGRRIGRLRGPAPGRSIAYAPDGRRIAVVYADGSIALWDPDRSAPDHVLRGPAPQPVTPDGNTFTPPSASFSEDGTRIATAGADPTIRIWDTATGKPLRTLAAGTKPFLNTAFSPDGRLLVAGSAATAHVWRLPTGEHVRELPHADPGTYAFPFPPLGVGAQFSRDGRTIGTGGDLAVRAWNTATGQPLFQATAPTGSLDHRARFVVTASIGGVSVYRCELCGGLNDLRSTARRNLTRDFTGPERARFLHEG